MYGLIEIYDDEHYLVTNSKKKIREFTKEEAEEYARKNPTNEGYFLFEIVGRVSKWD